MASRNLLTYNRRTAPVASKLPALNAFGLGWAARFNSTDSASSVAAAAAGEIKSEIGQISQTVSDAVDAASNAAESITAAATVAPNQFGYFQSLGLAQSWWWPPDFFQHIFELMHVYSGLPWWASIMAVTIAMRTLLFPLYLKASDHSAKMTVLKPELNKITQEYLKIEDPLEGQRLLIKRRKLMQDSGVKTLYLMMPMLSIPFFIGIFSGLNRMCSAKVFGMMDQGLFWFPDLTSPDPYLGLQVITALVYAATIKMGGETGASPMSPGMKKIFQYMPFIAVPMTMGVPAATCLYFATNSVLSVGQTLLLRSATTRKLLGLHPIVQPKIDPATENMSALDTLKQTFQKAKDRAEKTAKDNEREAKLRAEADRAMANEKVFIRKPSALDAKNKGKIVKKGEALRG